jgi:hypothetical protein
MRTGLEIFTITSHITDNKKGMSVVMTSITAEEEIELDKGNDICIKRGGMKITIPVRNVYCYGVIDFHTDSSDMNIIADFDWLDHLKFSGIIVPSNYDYDKHCAYSDLNVARQYDTFYPEVVAQYGHGVIGKPERTVIFRHNWKKHDDRF